MRKYILLCVLVSGMMLSTTAQSGFYDFTVKDIKGNDFSFSTLKGKKVLVVNTASKCGFTPQYDDLEKLYREFGGDQFVIIGFPANNFAKQEPGTNEEIAAFCKSEFDVSFPMMSKVSVKGDDIHPVYSWLTQKSLNDNENSSVSWNFQKYMISENGDLLGHIPSRKSPYNDDVIEWLTK